MFSTAKNLILQPKVAFLSHYGGLYGANLSLLALINGICQYGWYCFVVAPHEGEFIDALADQNIEAVISPFELSSHALGFDNFWCIQSRRSYSTGWFYRAARVAYRNYKRRKSLTALLASRGVNLVHSNSSWISIGAYASRQLGIPHVWHLREFGVADYACYPDFGLTYQKKSIRAAGMSICISAAIRDHYFEASCNPKNFKIIYNGVEKKTIIEKRLFEYISAGHSRDQAVFTFASIGLLHECKGHEIVIEAFARLLKNQFQSRLLIAGDGPFENELRKLVSNLGLNNSVRFLGKVVDMKSVYGIADAVVVASKAEAMGRVTVESMAYGLPVIGRNSGATPELVRDGVTGLIFDGTADDLSKKMTLLIQSPILLREMGVASLKDALEKYSIEKYIESTCDLFIEQISSLQTQASS